MAIKQRSFAMYILLTFVTCGIYSLYFWYVFTEDLNRICAEKVPGNKPSMNFILVWLLSTVTCGIYYYFWLYQQGNRMADAANGYGQNFRENGTTYLMWCLFGALLCGVGPIYGMYLMLKNMNVLAFNYNNEHGFAM